MNKDIKTRKRRRSPFQKALDAANKRLDAAIKEHNKAEQAVARLNHEIPNLRRTIVALESQLKPAQFLHLSEVSSLDIESVAKSIKGPSNDTPLTEALKYASPQVLAEQDLLPEPEGTPLTPED
jgi:chromosome segregation ATPase